MPIQIVAQDSIVIDVVYNGFLTADIFSYIILTFLDLYNSITTLANWRRLKLWICYRRGQCLVTNRRFSVPRTTYFLGWLRIEGKEFIRNWSFIRILIFFACVITIRTDESSATRPPAAPQTTRALQVVRIRKAAVRCVRKKWTCSNCCTRTRWMRGNQTSHPPSSIFCLFLRWGLNESRSSVPNSWLPHLLLFCLEGLIPGRCESRKD